jgi:hypothetical protein
MLMRQGHEIMLILTLGANIALDLVYSKGGD